MSVRLHLRNGTTVNTQNLITSYDIGQRRRAGEKKIERTLIEVRRDLIEILTQLEGRQIIRFQEQQGICNEINEFLQICNLRIQCPECNKESLLRCYRNRQFKPAFQYAHTYPISIRHGWETNFPESIILVEATRPRNRKKMEY